MYDYNAVAPGELTIVEDELLLVFDREEEWILVQSQKEGGKAGFIPGNYVEEVLFGPSHCSCSSLFRSTPKRMRSRSTMFLRYALFSHQLRLLTFVRLTFQVDL